MTNPSIGTISVNKKYNLHVNLHDPPSLGSFLFSSYEFANRDSLVESGEADGVFVE